jgi:hypothetical protein
MGIFFENYLTEDRFADRLRKSCFVAGEEKAGSGG